MINNTTNNSSTGDFLVGGLPLFVQVRKQIDKYLIFEKFSFSLSFYFYLLLLYSWLQVEIVLSYGLYLLIVV
jgi:hypothetical protein